MNYVIKNATYPTTITANSKKDFVSIVADHYCNNDSYPFIVSSNNDEIIVGFRIKRNNKINSAHDRRVIRKRKITFISTDKAVNNDFIDAFNKLNHCHLTDKEADRIINTKGNVFIRDDGTPMTFVMP